MVTTLWQRSLTHSRVAAKVGMCQFCDHNSHVNPSLRTGFHLKTSQKALKPSAVLRGVARYESSCFQERQKPEEDVVRAKTFNSDEGKQEGYWA